MKWLQAKGLADMSSAPTSFRVATDRVEIRTEKARQMIDVTELMEERVRRSGITTGILSAHTLHTTAALVTNENEARLLRDFEGVLERIAPLDGQYLHDDLEARWPRPAPDERPNGHAHCRALVLGSSVTLNVAGGKTDLGAWQRVFLVELDGPRARTLSIHVLGLAR